MTTETIVGHDIYYRINPTIGKSRVAYARVWDGDIFLEAQRHAGAKSKKKEDRFTISPATKDEYIAEMAKR